MTFLMPPNMMVVNMVKPILDQKSIEETFEIWKHKTPEIIRNGWIYWTPVSVILFNFIRIELTRIYVFNFFAYFWQCYLAFKVNQELKHQ